MTVEPTVALSTLSPGDTFDSGGLVLVVTNGPAASGNVGVVSLSSGSYQEMPSTAPVIPHDYKAVPVG